MITSAPLSNTQWFPSSLSFSHLTVLPPCSYHHFLPHFQPDLGPRPLLVAGYEDGSLLLWDVIQRSKLSLAKAHPDPVMCLTFDTKHLRGISGSSENKLASWTLDSQNNLQVSGRYAFIKLCCISDEAPHLCYPHRQHQ